MPLSSSEKHQQEQTDAEFGSALEAIHAALYRKQSQFPGVSIGTLLIEGLCMERQRSRMKAVVTSQIETGSEEADKTPAIPRGSAFASTRIPKEKIPVSAGIWLKKFLEQVGLL